MEALAEEREAPLHMEAQAEESGAPLSMEVQAAAEESAAPPRTHSFLFGCMLSATKRKVSFPGGGDDMMEQLTLRTVSLGPGAPDVLHVLEVEGETRQGTIRVPVAALHPSLLTSVYLGGLELTPPVTFWLTAGTGSLYISGQHLVALTESDAAAAKAAAKREAASKAAAKREAVKIEAARRTGKALGEKEAAALASAERLAAAGRASAERLAAAGRASAERLAAAGRASAERLAAAKASAERLAAAGKASAERLAAAGKASAERLAAAGKASAERLAAAKASAERLAAAGKASAERLAAVKASMEREAEQTQGRLMVKPERVALPLSQSNDGAGSPSKEEKPSETLTVEQMKEKLDSLSKRGIIPETVDKFRTFVRYAFLTEEPLIVQQLWQFAQRDPPPTGEKPPQPLTIEQMKERLVSLSEEGAMPTTFRKFRKLVFYTLGMGNPRIVQDLWEFVQREKRNGLHPPMTVEQMKETLVSLSKQGSGIPETIEQFRTFSYYTFHTDEPLIVQQMWEFVLSEKLNLPPGPLTLEQMKEILVSLSKRDGIPTTLKKFRKFARNILRTDEPLIVQQLWQFVLSEKQNSPAAPLTVEQMKEKLVSFSKRGGLPRKLSRFRTFVHFILGTKEPLLVQQLWEFVLSKKLNNPPATTERNPPPP
ncbi:uncharacterized protein [Ambystoma mexicanum]|uniref:uncharacterized protein n=1 Tax=Ambystoma mexicanum TaxID=8296 RepID=UPI0037E937D2